MSDERLQAIRERLKRERLSDLYRTPSLMLIELSDVSYLLSRDEQREKRVAELETELEAAKKQISLLCPIGDLDTITTLLTEKQDFMERIAELEQENERLRQALGNYVSRCVCDDEKAHLQNSILVDCPRCSWARQILSEAKKGRVMR